MKFIFVFVDKQARGYKSEKLTSKRVEIERIITTFYVFLFI